MFETLLTWLPGGTDKVYQSVWFEFHVPFGLLAAISLLIFVFALGAVFWWSRLKQVRGWRRGGLTAMRVGGLALVLFLVLDPSLVGRRSEPGKHFVLVLVDDSKSMQVPGGDGRHRGERFLDAYTAMDSRFEETLRQSHQVVLFRFGKDLERLTSVQDLNFEQKRSDLLGAVDGALRKMLGTNVSAVVLFSDGVQQSDGPPVGPSDFPTEVPVFTVGTGLESRWQSLELAGISVGRTNFDHSPVAVIVRVVSEGLVGEKVVVEVLDGKRVVQSTSFAVAEDRAENSVRLEFVPRQSGWVSYRAQVRLAGGAPLETLVSSEKDPIAENNVRDFVVDNRDRTYRILYFSGRPTWEIKFVRRALEEAPQLALTSLIRISGPERKFVFRGAEASLANPLFEGFDDSAHMAPRYDEAVFIRIGTQASELATGYPLEAEDLYRYHLVIWGDIERAFFAQGQLELTRDFVSRRGGSLMLMGGPRSFAEGGYGKTVIEAMLPVVLGAGGDDMELLFHPKPTIEGTLSGIWSLASETQHDRELWETLPALYGVNRFATTRAGATVLAEVHGASDALDGQPLFVWQRYGKGRCAVLATGETWQWQMMRKLEDDVHERFWRQLMRGLVKDVPEPVVLTQGEEGLTVGESRSLTFLVRDSLFAAQEGLATEVQLADPDAKDWPLPVEESITEAGVYTAEFLAETEGMHHVRLTARNDRGTTIGHMETAVMVHPDHREFQRARYQPDFLKQIASASGGNFFTLDELDELAKQIPWTDTVHERLDRFHLWHFPPFYVLVVVLLVLEWYMRRKQGQP
ncbi:MAG: glutamine amidotransferase [bacterium]|nr:glutamine amidotransferase [bacterium]